MFNKQRTIKNSISVSGVGLHNGKKVNVTLNPSPVNTGVIFRRVDVDEIVKISVSPTQVGETSLCTALVKDGVKISTIEHLMSAISGMGIDNISIDVDEEEIPILDGSASLFIFLLQSAGIETQDENKKFVRILKEIKVDGDYDSWAKIEPYNGFKLSFKIDFQHPMAESHKGFSIDFTSTSYLKEMSRARTFGFLKDMDRLKSNSKALGSSINNAIILNDKGVINEHGLRFDDELVKHKILDAVGDLFVLKYPIIGHFSAYKSGHGLNNRLLRVLLDNPDSWETVSFNTESQIPMNFIDSKIS